MNISKLYFSTNFTGNMKNLQHICVLTKVILEIIVPQKYKEDEDWHDHPNKSQVDEDKTCPKSKDKNEFAYNIEDELSECIHDVA